VLNIVENNLYFVLYDIIFDKLNKLYFQVRKSNPGTGASQTKVLLVQGKTPVRSQTCLPMSNIFMAL
jgi:hypothetical protein